MFEKHLDEHIDQITFHSKSGELRAVKKDDLIFLDFPADHLKKVKDKEFILNLLGFEPQLLFKGRDDYLAIFETEKIIMELIPNFIEISKIDSRGLIATAHLSQHCGPYRQTPRWGQAYSPDANALQDMDQSKEV